MISMGMKNGDTRSPSIYDRLAFCKGPSLGTVFTLACPFTLLAHYTELEWAESCGVSRYLIRISVGLEDPEDLWRRLDELLGRHRLRFTHVRGHSGHVENERCDTLAVAAYQKYLKG